MPVSGRKTHTVRKGGGGHASSGQQAKLSRPLDFWSSPITRMAWVSSRCCFRGIPRSLAFPQARKWYDMIQEGKGVEAALDLYFNLGKGTIERTLAGARHSRVSGRVAEDDRRGGGGERSGSILAFIGFEWTSGSGATTCIATSSSATARQGQPSGAVHRPEIVRQRQSARPLEVHGRL